MKVLVTGSNGFIGSHMCKLLVEQGHDVHAMVEAGTSMSLLEDMIPGLHGIEVFEGNVCDAAGMKQAFAGMDVVINFAGVIKGLNRSDYDKVNIDGNVNACEAALAAGLALKRLVLVSSAAAAGPSKPGGVVCEADPMACLDGDWYGQSKMEMERRVQAYLGKIPVTIVRPPPVFGPGDMPTLQLFQLVKGGKKLVLGKDPKYYSVVDVRDLCEGILAAMTHPGAVDQVFYFTTGDPVEWGELQEIIGRTVFDQQKPLKTIRISHGLAIFAGALMQAVGKLTRKAPFINKGKMIEGSATGWVNSSEKARALLGWQPTRTIESMVKDAGAWYIAHGML